MYISELQLMQLKQFKILNKRRARKLVKYVQSFPTPPPSEISEYGSIYIIQQSHEDNYYYSFLFSLNLRSWPDRLIHFDRARIIGRHTFLTWRKYMLCLFANSSPMSGGISWSSRSILLPTNTRNTLNHNSWEEKKQGQVQVVGKGSRYRLRYGQQVNEVGTVTGTGSSYRYRRQVQVDVTGAGTGTVFQETVQMMR